MFDGWTIPVDLAALRGWSAAIIRLHWDKPYAMRIIILKRKS